MLPTAHSEAAFDEAKIEAMNIALRGRKRGRPVGSGAGVKRKATEDLSNNVHTVRARQRLANQNEYESAIRRADNADRAALSRRKKALRASIEYQQMSPDEQKMSEQIAEQEELSKRFVVLIVTINI
jgi:hypothetical protein